MAGFRPQANLPFVAAYVAEEKGYFEEQGLDVDIRHSTGEHLNLLMAGEVDFTTVDANSVLKRRADPGLPVVAIALFGQRGQQAFLALSDSGHQRPEGLGGEDIRVQGQHTARLPRDPGSRGRGPLAHPGGQGWVRPSHPYRGSGRCSSLVQVQRAQHHPWAWAFDVNMFDAADYGVPTLGLTYIVQQEHDQRGLRHRGAIPEARQ